jgi:hypothetical protein
LRRFLTLLTLLAAGGCWQEVAGLEGSPGMMPGSNCIDCHRAGGAADFHQFSVAGTVYASPDAGENDGVQGVEILVTDGAGRKLTLTSNGAGNFYTAEPLVAPIMVAAQWGQTRMFMAESPPAGVPDGHTGVSVGCALCHTLPPGNGGVAFAPPAPGRLFVPRPPEMK